VYGADEGTRTLGLDVGDVAFWPLNYIREIEFFKLQSE
jgi:hypothetical protein